MIMHSLKVSKHDVKHPKHYAQDYYQEEIDSGKYDKVVLSRITEEVWETHEERQINKGAW